MKFAGVIFFSVALAQYAVPKQQYGQDSNQQPISARDQCLLNCNGASACQLGCDNLTGAPQRADVSPRDQCLLACGGDQACGLKCDNVVLQNTTNAQQPMSNRDVCLTNCKGEVSCQLGCDKLVNQSNEDALNFNACITKCNSGPSAQYDQPALLACQNLCNVSNAAASPAAASTSAPSAAYTAVAYSSSYAYSSISSPNGTRSGSFSSVGSSSGAYNSSSMYYATAASQTNHGAASHPLPALVLAGIISLCFL